jgi:phosphatidylglycerophosphate synthase
MAMWYGYSLVEPTPGQAVFHTRLTLSVIDLAGGPGAPGVAAAVIALADRIVDWADGYAARRVEV